MVPGVHGRVTELSKVSQRKYYLAMALVLGRDLDSIIVDTNKTAQECIRWLRENHVPPMTFFPLDIVRAKACPTPPQFTRPKFKFELVHLKEAAGKAHDKD